MLVLKVSIRHVIIDQLRRRDADKRGSDQRRAPLDEGSAAALTPEQVMREVNDAIETLSGCHPRVGRVLRAHVYEGRTFDEISRTLGISRKTAVQDWASARAFLAREPRSDPPRITTRCNRVRRNSLPRLRWEGVAQNRIQRARKPRLLRAGALGCTNSSAPSSDQLSLIISAGGAESAAGPVGLPSPSLSASGSLIWSSRARRIFSSALF